MDVISLEVLALCDASALCAASVLNTTWRRSFLGVNGPGQELFKALSLQRWPWLFASLQLTHGGHHLWQRYRGCWRALCMDENRANSVCSLTLRVPCYGSTDNKYDKLQSEWVAMPEKDFQLRLTAYPRGNQRAPSTHLSAYLEAFCTDENWHVALDFTLVAESAVEPMRKATWSSGPVRYVACSTGVRVDWGCHKLIPNDCCTDTIDLSAHVALQEACIEAAHVEDVRSHEDEFGLCCFGYMRSTRLTCKCCCSVKLAVSSAVTKAELNSIISEALGRPVSTMRRFSRGHDADGRLACNLPEAPRHPLGSSLESNSENDDLDLYGLLTKWTQGESSGGARQNFFRFLALSDDSLAAPVLPYVGRADRSEQCRVLAFIKRFDVGEPLRFQAAVQVQSNLDECRLDKLWHCPFMRRLSEGSAGSPWALVREGSPFDWGDEECLTLAATWQKALADTACALPLLNSRGPITEAEVLVACPVSALPALVSLYNGIYKGLVAAFVKMYKQEAEQRGSVPFHKLCDVMECLNVDVWRLEQQLGATTTRSSMLELFEMLPGLHPQFFCDACGSSELRGGRYNCLDCSDFDICSTCFATMGCSDCCIAAQVDRRGTHHQRTHRLIRIPPPLPADCLRKGSKM